MPKKAAKKKGVKKKSPKEGKIVFDPGILFSNHALLAICGWDCVKYSPPVNTRTSIYFIHSRVPKVYC